MKMKFESNFEKSVFHNLTNIEALLKALNAWQISKNKNELPKMQCGGMRKFSAIVKFYIRTGY